MKPVTKQVLLFVVTGGFTVLTTGCESLEAAAWSPAVGAADDPTLTVSRARVVAELREAHRLGLITVGEETPRDLTEREMHLIAQAGEAAAVAEVATAKAK